MKTKNIISTILLLMSLISLTIFLISSNGDGVFSVIELLSFIGIFLAIPFLIIWYI